jgi:FMN phosphatase YigB (HAD superfamily)
VLFIDDRAENTRTARDLGMHTITFTSASDLDRELRLATPEIPIAEAGRQHGCSE